MEAKSEAGVKRDSNPRHLSHGSRTQTSGCLVFYAICFYVFFIFQSFFFSQFLPITYVISRLRMSISI